MVAPMTVTNQETGEETVQEREVTRYAVFGRYYLPEETVQLAGNEHYAKWVKQGLIIETPGAMTDYYYIENDIKRLNKDHPIIELAFDPSGATYLVNNLMDLLGPERCIEITQGPTLISEPMKELEGLIYAKAMMHNGDPVLTWMMGNVVKKQGRSGGPVKTYYPTKQKEEYKIDGPVALIMAMSRAMLRKDTRSAYESPDAEVLTF
jgi:phage terminase large subunit-like protein